MALLSLQVYKSEDQKAFTASATTQAKDDDFFGVSEVFARNSLFSLPASADRFPREKVNSQRAF